MEYQIILTVTGSNISLTMPIQDAIYMLQYMLQYMYTYEQVSVQLDQYIMGTRTAGFPFLKHA